MKKVSFDFIFVLILLSALISIATAGEPAPNADRERLSPAAGICVSRAQELFQSGRVQQAVDLLKTFTLKKDNQHYYLYFLMGNYYLTLAGQKDQPQNSQTLSQYAADCFQESVTLKPAFPEGWLNLAKCRYETGDFANAAAAFEQGYTTSPIPRAEHLYLASVCYFQAKNSQKALDVFDRMITALPEEISPAYKETLVHILFSLESHHKALPYIEELAKESLPPKKKQWQEILLQQYLALDMDEKALVYADFLTRTDTLEPRWWKALCHIHLNSNRIQQGLSALIIYGYLTPMTKEELMLAGDLYRFLNIPEKAALFYENAKKIL